MIQEPNHQMNSKGQFDPISAMWAVLVLVMFAGVFLSIFNTVSCTNEKSQISSLQGSINACNTSLEFADKNAAFYKHEYETLRDQNITKQDFVDLKAQVNDLNYNLTLINNQIYSLNQQITNTVYLLNLSLWLNVALLPLTLFTFLDFTFFGLNVSRKIHTKLVQVYQNTFKSNVTVENKVKL